MQMGINKGRKEHERKKKKAFEGMGIFEAKQKKRHQFREKGFAPDIGKYSERKGVLYLSKKDIASVSGN